MNYKSVSLVLFGLCLGLGFSVACGDGGIGSANADDLVECVIHGPVEVTATTAAPLPVMICDGQDPSGDCADVYTNYADENYLRSN